MNNIPTAQTIVYSSELPPGFQIGAYVIDRKLGQGGFGVTYLAHEAATDRPVVIKENFPRQCSHRDSVSLMVGPASEEQAAEFQWALDRFLDEARMLAKLSHPGIVPVLTTFEALGTAYYVMPPVPGIDIHKAAPPPDEINEEWLLPILRQLLETLEYLHSQGVLHRDIKPANILLEHDGDPVLIDFGTARALNTSYSLTLMGTPGYGPLEQFSDGDKNGPWTDLYSLGATCFRLITGKDPQRALSRVVEDNLPLLSRSEELHQRFSHELLTSIDIALHMSRRKRWQSARQWLSYLDKASNQTRQMYPIELPQPEPPKPALPKPPPVLPKPPPVLPEPDMYLDGEQIRELYKAKRRAEKEAQRRAMLGESEIPKKEGLPTGCVIYLIISFICGVFGVIYAIDEGMGADGMLQYFFIGFCAPTFLILTFLFGGKKSH